MHTLTSLLELASTPDGLQQIGEIVAELTGRTVFPDHPSDLNSCAALRKGLRFSERLTCNAYLREVMSEPLKPGEFVEWSACIDATPVQHCIAYILTRQDQPTKGAEQ